MRINQLQPLHPDRAEHVLTYYSHNTYIHTHSHTHSTQDAVQIQIIRVDTAWFILRFGRQSIVFMAKNRYLNILSMLYCVITKSYCSSSSASSLLQMAACLLSLIRQYVLSEHQQLQSFMQMLDQFNQPLFKAIVLHVYRLCGNAVRRVFALCVMLSVPVVQKRSFLRGRIIRLFLKYRLIYIAGSVITAQHQPMYCTTKDINMMLITSVTVAINRTQLFLGRKRL